MPSGMAPQLLHRGNCCPPSAGTARGSTPSPHLPFPGKKMDYTTLLTVLEQQTCWKPLAEIMRDKLANWRKWGIETVCMCHRPLQLCTVGLLMSPWHTWRAPHQPSAMPYCLLQSYTCDTGTTMKESLTKNEPPPPCHTADWLCHEWGLQLDCMVEGIHCQALMDTGSIITLICPSIYWLVVPTRVGGIPDPTCIHHRHLCTTAGTDHRAGGVALKYPESLHHRAGPVMPIRGAHRWAHSHSLPRWWLSSKMVAGNGINGHG